jgi:hypothetical protein
LVTTFMATPLMDAFAGRKVMAAADERAYEKVLQAGI